MQAAHRHLQALEGMLLQWVGAKDSQFEDILRGGNLATAAQSGAIKMQELGTKHTKELRQLLKQRKLLKKLGVVGEHIVALENIAWHLSLQAQKSPIRLLKCSAVYCTYLLRMLDGATTTRSSCKSPQTHVRASMLILLHFMHQTFRVAEALLTAAPQARILSLQRGNKECEHVLHSLLNDIAGDTCVLPNICDRIPTTNTIDIQQMQLYVRRLSEA